MINRMVGLMVSMIGGVADSFVATVGRLGANEDPGEMLDLSVAIQVNVSVEVFVEYLDRRVKLD